MKASKRAATIGSGMDRAIEAYGDLIWEAICDRFPTNQLFSIEECVPLVQQRVSLSHRYATSLVRATLYTVLDQGAGVVQRHGRTRWSV